MTSRRSLTFIFFAVVLYGGVIGYYSAYDRDPPKLVDLAGTLVPVVLTYVWYYLDASEIRYQRTGALGAAIVLISVFAVPYYLWRSRDPGQKVGALFKLVGFCLVTFLAGAGAAVLGTMLA